MSVVYVVIESDKPITAANKGDVIGVVTTEEQANTFYQGDPERRDYIPFNLDELPELTGTPGQPLPAPAAQPAASDDYAKLLEQTRNRVNETAQRMQRLTDKMNQRKK